MKSILQSTIKLCVCIAASIRQELETKLVALKSGFCEFIIYRFVFKEVMLIKL